MAEPAPFWGLVAVACAFCESIALTVLEAVNSGVHGNGPLLLSSHRQSDEARIPDLRLNWFAAGLLRTCWSPSTYPTSLAVVNAGRLGIRLHLAWLALQNVNACRSVTAIVPICSQPAQRLYPDSADAVLHYPAALHRSAVVALAPCVPLRLLVSPRQRRSADLTSRLPPSVAPSLRH